MKTFFDCIPCAMQQALRAARMSTTDESKIKEVLNRVGQMVQFISLEATPVDIGDEIYKIIREVTQVDDPFKKIKEQHIKEAKVVYGDLQQWLDGAEDRLLMAIKMAIAGNIIDLGVNKSFNILTDVKKVVEQEFAHCDYEAFKSQLSRAKEVLYIGDNAGESVFDKLLIKELNRPVKYVVRSVPVINDVLREDAIASGLNEVADIVEAGTCSPGMIERKVTPDFKTLFDNADLVISKGQGNFEGLSSSNREIFFLLRAKCQVIAKHLNVDEGGIVLLHSHNIKE